MSDPAAQVTVKRVVAGVLVRGDEVLCCQRPHLGPFPLKWEFPGGKIEALETPEMALARELKEELGIDAEIGPQIEAIRHSYLPGVIVELYFFRVERWRDEIQNLIFNDVRWVKRERLDSLDFLDADKKFVAEISSGRTI